MIFPMNHSHSFICKLRKQYHFIACATAFIVMSIQLSFAQVASPQPSVSQTVASVDTIAQIEKAYKKNPSNKLLKLAYAKVASCSTSVGLYRSLSADTSAPDSVRASASAALGDYNFADEKYEKAASYYQDATRLTGKSHYRHLWALAAAVNGDEETAKSLWHTIAVEKEGTDGLMSQFYVGMLNMKNENYESAYNAFLKCGSSGSYPWSVQALVGKLICCSKLGLSAKVAEYRAQLDLIKGTILEKDLLNKDLSPIVKTPIVIAADTSDTNVAKVIKNRVPPASAEKKFTLQIGAFGSMENADSMKKKYVKDFSTISIQPTTVGEQVLYRVRIGSFVSKEEAQAFALQNLDKAGISYRITEK